MLVRPKDIFSVEPPFLILLGNGNWRVARAIHPHPDGLAYVEPFSSADAESPSGVLAGEPWHVGNHVWEMEYNTQIMTLDHPYHRAHPAWQLWLQWLQTEGNRQRSH